MENDKRCVVCDGEVEDMNGLLSGHCHECSFWMKHATVYDNSVVVIVNNTHYRMGESTAFKGFGGREFTILFNDGRRVVTTSNLWCQGEIPVRFQALLPDNAVFLDDINLKPPVDPNAFPF